METVAKQADISDFVGVFEGAFPPQYCEDVIREFEVLYKNGFTLDRQQTNDAVKTLKDDYAISWNQLMTIALDEQQAAQVKNPEQLSAPIGALHHLIGEKFSEVFWEEIYPTYAKKYSVLSTASDSHTIYHTKVQKSLVGQGYHVWHYESANRNVSNRILTYIVYLNDVEEGGETELLYQSKRIKAKQGTLVLFPAAFTHTHRGNPPLSNSKYIITGWVEF